jgi:outer membrane protein OmpA-like peptidoglycan-associated protein
MSILPNQRRCGRARDAGLGADRRPDARFGSDGGGAGSGPSASSSPDALADLRRAVTALDPSGFADCFCAAGWLRVPHPDGDALLHGRAEIQQAAAEVGELLTELSWTPSQRFVSADQVVEEALARAGTRSRSASSDPVQVALRVVAGFDPAGGIAGLTLWVDWAALNDPRGVDSPRGAASALVAQARAQDARGLRVIETEPWAAPLLRPPAVAVPAPRTVRSARPPGTVLWWRRHRATLAGSVMAVAAATVIGWVALGVLKPVVDAPLSAAGPPSLPAPSAARPTGTAAPRPPTAATVPVPRPTRTAARSLPRPERNRRPTVQAGEQITLTSAVLFRSNSTDLTPAAKAKLQTVADRVRRYAMTGTIQVNGYTDAIGTEAGNIVLAQRRADAVAAALRPRIADLPVKITPQAFGEDAPIASNRTAAGRQANRRVTIVLPEHER